MWYLFDLEGEKFSRFLFFPDAITALSVPNSLGSKLSLPVWGVVLPEPQQDPQLCAQLPLEVQVSMPTALYLSGWGVLSFQGVQRGEIRVWPYQSTLELNNLTFPPNQDSRLPPLSHCWTESTQGQGRDYVLSIVLEQPLGFMALNIQAAGPVTLSVHPHDFVTEEQLDSFPERYRYDLTRSRHLQHLLQSDGLEAQLLDRERLVKL
jgi:hypothetical protein